MSIQTSGLAADDFASELYYLDLGRALYHPKSSTILKPGAVGFFDSYGQWVNLAAYADSQSFVQYALTPLPEEFKHSECETQSWDSPLTSNSIKSSRLHLEADLTAAGLPASANAGFQFKLGAEVGTEVGAVLVTSPRAERRYCNVAPALLRRWIHDNRVSLIRGPLQEDFRTHGIIVITGTWTVKRYALTAWRGREKSTSLGFGGNASQGGSVMVSGEWYHGENVGRGWISGQAEKDEQIAVFVMGLHFRWSRLLQGFKPAALRSASTDMAENLVLPLEDGEAVEVECRELAATGRGRGNIATAAFAEDGDEEGEL